MSGVWRFAGTLLPPADPERYTNVVIDALPLTNGGWVVLRVDQPSRHNCSPTTFGCFFRPPYGRLLRLDPDGRVVAEEHGPEPFGLTHLSVFETPRVVVGEGRQVKNGNLHAFDLDSLDGLATELTTCVPVDGRCWAYRSYRLYGGTALEEREPRTLSVLRTYPHLTMDLLQEPPSIFPSANLIVWPSPERPTRMRAEPLDQTRPIASPLVARLRAACHAVRVADDRIFVSESDSACDAASGGRTEILEVSTGRSVRAMSVNATTLPGSRGVVAVDSVLRAVDPRTGSDGPQLWTAPFVLDFARGIGALPLSDGGVAVLRRVIGAERNVALTFREVATGTCESIDFPRVVIASPASSCDVVAAAPGPARLVVAAGRSARSPATLDIRRVTFDATTRTMDVSFQAGRSRGEIESPSAVRVIELASPPTGEWLVRLVPDGGGRPLGAFVVRFG